MRPLTRIVLHHTAGSELDTPEMAAKYAVDRKVGITHDPYHWHIWRGPDQGVGVNAWRVDAGRDMSEIPASSHGENEGTISVTVHGDWSKSPLPIWARDLLVSTVAGLCTGYGIDARQIFGHREMVGEQTACPGYDPEVIRQGVREALYGRS